MIGGIFFALGWTATVIYFIYSLGIAIREPPQRSSVLHCTQLAPRQRGRQGRLGHISRHSSNYHSWLDNANDAMYTVNQTLPWFYSTHHREYAVENPQGISGGTIFGMVMVCLFALPILFAIGAGIFTCYIFIRYESHMALEAWTYSPTQAREWLVGKMPSNMTDTIVRYMLIPVNFCKKGFENSVSWVKSIKWSKKNNTQAKNTCDLEDQKSQVSRASSGTSYRSDPQKNCCRL